jgi:asparagine synthase (glutamine-hydrolysing)
MCGFTIFISRKKNIKFQNKNTLNHRGPDFFNSIKFKNILLNHWRLSIVDHSKKSNQPLINKNYIFVYNGEIYDYSELSKNFKLDNYINSDTRFLFSLLNKKNNLNDIKKFSGFYSYAFLNKKKNILSFSRDVLGKKPLFYYFDNEKFIISSEEKGILNFIKKEVNSLSVIEYFFYKHVHFNNTFFKGINSIVPGALLKFDINNWSLKSNKNWKQFYNEKLLKNKNSNKFIENFKQILFNSIEKRNFCDVKTQLALSSGFDSSLILNIIKKKLNIKNFYRSISIGFDKKNNETLIAKKISQILKSKLTSIIIKKPKLKNLEEIIKYYDAPLEHPSSIGVDLICKKAKKFDKVLITGEGADDLFFGYDHYRNKKNNSFAFRVFLKDKILKEILSNKKNLEFFKVIENKKQISFFRKKALKSIFFSRELELKTHMQTLLKRNDRISMKNSIEIRCPFLDSEILKLVPANKILNKKVVLKKFFDQEVYNLIDNKKKIGFYVPLSYIYNSNKTKFNKYIRISLKYFNSCGFYIDNSLLKNHEVKWVLLNIGIFLKLHG